MKISIERLKEIIMEEVARATAIEEEDVPGSEDYEAGIEAEKKRKKKKKEEEERERSLDLLRSRAGLGAAFGAPPVEESLNIEIVDDE